MLRAHGGQLGIRNTTSSVGFLGPLSVWDVFLLQLWHPTVLAAFCMLHGHEDWTTDSRSPQAGVSTHPCWGCQSHSARHFSTKAGGKDVPGKRCRGQYVQTGHRIHYKTLDQVRWAILLPKDENASVTVKSWPEIILPSTSSLHLGMAMQIGIFIPEHSWVLSFFPPSHLCVFFVPKTGFYKSFWSLWAPFLVVPGMKKDRGRERKFPQRACTLPD